MSIRNGKTIKAADLFCGAGGTSTGLRQACEALGLNLKLVAVNHWDLAIATHSQNHAEAEHFCTDLDTTDPKKLVPSGRLDLLVASPECVHHSNAKGGTPINDQSRASAWLVLEWLSKIDVKRVLIENVPEFQSWGPLMEKRVTKSVKLPSRELPFDQWLKKARRHGGTEREWRRIYHTAPNAAGAKESVTITCWVPDPKRKGEIYIAFLKSLEAHGYKVEPRVLTCADYGDATTRERLFIQAAKKTRAITWPQPTHAAPEALAVDLPLFVGKSTLTPYKPAKDIIDWTIPGASIFGRKRPLAENTMARIWKGIERFVGKPFIVRQFSCGANRSVDDPLPTILTDGAHALCRPFIVVLRNNGYAQSVNDPLPTITASGTHHGLCQPFLINAGGPKVAPRSTDEPMNTILTRDHMAIIQPFLVRFNGNHQGRADGDNRVYSVEEPVKTLDTSNRMGLCQPFVIPVNHGKGDFRGYDLRNPFPTITSVDAWALIKPYLVKFNGTADVISLDDPLDTIPTKDRFALAEPRGFNLDGALVIVDILFRMLQPHELAAAMSFPRSYSFAGTREQKVKQIGNAVPCGTAKALCQAILGSM